MSYKISKELFEAVYNEDLLRIEIGTYSVVAYLTDGTEFTENIDTFFFDCKEWASSMGYDLYSYRFDGDVSYAYLDLDMKGVHPLRPKYGFVGSFLEEFEAETEQQAVFDACMYILDKDKQ